MATVSSNATAASARSTNSAHRSPSQETSPASAARAEKAAAGDNASAVSDPPAQTPIRALALNVANARGADAYSSTYEASLRAKMKEYIGHMEHEHP